MTDGLSKVNVQYTYHMHIDSCKQACTGKLYATYNNTANGQSNYSCNKTGKYIATMGGGCGIHSGKSCGEVFIICGKTEDTIESATIIY